MFQVGSFLRRRVVLIPVLLLAIGFMRSTPAAAQGSTGIISGVVADAQGGVLPGVTVTVRNQDTGVTRTTVTEANGAYRIAGLQPGKYEMKAELEGFAPVETKDVTVNVGQESGRNITMQLQGVQESLTVTGQAPVVETTKSDVSGIISQQQIETLPLASRQPVALALLMPGTSQDAVRPRKFNANLGAGAFTNAGAFLIDGVWNKEPCTGEPRQDFPQSAIREFKVNLSNATAEFGWTGSGVVTIATKSGTNTVSGEAFEFFRDKALNTMNKFEQASHDTKGTPKPNYRRNQFGVALGGPIVKDQLHFYAAVERTKENKYITVNTGKPQFFSALEGIFPEPEYSNTYFGKFDWQIGPNQSTFLRLAGQQQDYTCDTCGGTAAWNTDGGINQPRRSVTAGHTWVISSRALNELRGQWSYYGYFPHPAYNASVYDFGAYSQQRTDAYVRRFVFPSLTYGWNAGVYVLQWTREIRDDFSITTGAHTWKFGGGIKNMMVKDDVPPNNGTWTFGTDQFFDGSAAAAAALRSPTLFAATGPGTPILRNLPNYYSDLYVQDEWKPAPNLTVNLGIRYDLQTKIWNDSLNETDTAMFPTYGTAASLAPFYDFQSRGDKNNIAPRLGFAWDVNNNGNTVIRGAYGRYFNPIWSTVMRGEQTNYRQAAISIANPTYPDPYGGRDPLAFASTAPQNISIASNNLKNQWADATTFGISQGLSSVMALHADFVYNNMQDVPMTVSTNSRSGLTTGTRPNPAFAKIDILQNIGWNHYKALLMRLEKRLDKNYQLLISYTLAKSDGNIPFTGNAGRITQAENPNLDLGPTANDRRHVLVASGAYLLPGGVQLGAVWTIRTTMPFNAVAGADLNGDAIQTDYVPGTTRAMGNRDNTAMMAAVNAYRATLGLAPLSESQLNGNGYNAVDMRVNKSFSLGGNKKLELIAQVFNVFGTDNLQASGGVSGQTGVPPGWQLNARVTTFGQILQAYNKQQAELAIRFTF